MVRTFIGIPSVGAVRSYWSNAMFEREQWDVLGKFISYLSLQEDYAVCFYTEDGSLDGAWVPARDETMRVLIKHFIAWQEQQTQKNA
jgi:hypothetical protein